MSVSKLYRSVELRHRSVASLASARVNLSDGDVEFIPVAECARYRCQAQRPRENWSRLIRTNKHQDGATPARYQESLPSSNPLDELRETRLRLRHPQFLSVCMICHK